MKRKDRRSFFQKMGIFLGFLPFSKVNDTFGNHWGEKRTMEDSAVFFTTGFKIMEVDQHSAIFWTRLCASKKAVSIYHLRKKVKINFYPVDFDEEMPIEKMDGSVSGVDGQVRARIKRFGEELVSEWHSAESSNDYTVSLSFKNLKAGTKYDLILEARISPESKIYSTTGQFRTAPAKNEELPVSLATCTCQYFWNYDDLERGFKTYDSISKLGVDFFIHTGDYVYYDREGPLATSISKARHKWHAMDSRPSIRELYRKVPIYLLKDDHDLLKDDVHPDSSPLEAFTLEEGYRVWRENVPLEGKSYRTVRWGKDLQIWMVEGREYRSPRDVPEGKPRTIWGEEQKNWFRKTVEESDATFKLLFSPTPVVGPDRDNKRDNHANSLFEEEGNWLRKFLAAQNRMFVVNGDRHWQYYSVDTETGLNEFGAGPVSDVHAGGWSPDDVRPEHQYLRVKGGFLGIKVNREKGRPEISFTHYNVDGGIENEISF